MQINECAQQTILRTTCLQQLLLTANGGLAVSNFENIAEDDIFFFCTYAITCFCTSISLIVLSFKILINIVSSMSSSNASWSSDVSRRALWLCWLETGLRKDDMI